MGQNRTIDRKQYNLGTFQNAGFFKVEYYCNTTINTETTGCLRKRYTKLIKHNLKLITSINDTELFLDCAQANLDFECSFVEC